MKEECSNRYSWLNCRNQCNVGNSKLTQDPLRTQYFSNILKIWHENQTTNQITKKQETKISSKLTSTSKILKLVVNQRWEIIFSYFSGVQQFWPWRVDSCLYPLQKQRTEQNVRRPQICYRGQAEATCNSSSMV